MFLTGALDVGLVGVEDMAHAYAVVAGTEEVGEVERLAFVIHKGFQHFGGAAYGHITAGIHITHHDVGTAEEVDPVFGSLHVLGIFGDYPAVEPYGEAFPGESITKVHTQFARLFDGPDRVAAPVQVNPSGLLHHLVLAEVGLPSRHKFFRFGQPGLYGGDVFVGSVVHQVIGLDAACGDVFLVNLQNYLGIDVAGGVLDEDASLVLGVVENIPGGSFLVAYVFGVVQDAGGTPHIAYGIVIGVLAATFHLVEA